MESAGYNGLIIASLDVAEKRLILWKPGGIIVVHQNPGRTDFLQFQNPERKAVFSRHTYLDFHGVSAGDTTF